MKKPSNFLPKIPGNPGNSGNPGKSRKFWKSREIPEILKISVDLGNSGYFGNSVNAQQLFLLQSVMIPFLRIYVVYVYVM